MTEENQHPESEEELEPEQPKPPQYYVVFNSDGNIAGFYVDSINDAIPETAIPIDTQDWEVYKDEPGKYKLDGDIIREKTRQELDDEAAAQPPAPPSPIQILETENADLWYQVMLNESRDTQQDNDIAELFYEIMMGGA